MNLLEPGKNPHDNQQFLLFLCAVIKAVDEYPDLLRVSAANAGNDHRLGANEAPPAIISIFLGDQLEDVLEQIEKGPATSSKSASELTIGVNTLPALPKDATDRNRTSPFAFTGNKFEFRMVPSSASIAGCNFVLNTIVAETLSEIAEKLEKATNLDAEIQAILTDIVKKHKRIIFNGNGYSDEWVVEAEKRGLPNIKSTVEAAKAMISEKNQAVLEKHGVLTKVEAESRYEITLENYNKIINIEALTTLEMAKRQIIPAVIQFTTSLAESINTIKATGVGADVSVQTELLTEVSKLTASLSKNVKLLEELVEKADNFKGDIFDLGMMYRYEVFEQMNVLREDADKLETIVDEDFWPLPTYSDMLFNV
jgi:glutamine synthetase